VAQPAPRAVRDRRGESRKEGTTVATFVVLGKMTDQGVRNIKELPKLVRENMQRGEALGMSVKGWYLTQGEYDFVVVVEAPDAETQAVQALGIAMRGNSRTNTMRAFPLEEMERIIAKLP
jgi:uncharacterized protein with GYD domain